MLGICCLGCGLAVLWLAGGKTAVLQRGKFMLVIAAVMGLAQWGLAVAGLWTLAALGSTLAGLLLAILYFSGSQPAMVTRWQLVRAGFLSYILLMAVIMIGQLVLGERLSFLVIDPFFPAVETSLGWQIAAGGGRSLDLFGHAGALLLYASLLTFAWYRWRGTDSERCKQLTVNGERLAEAVHYRLRNTHYTV
jgi:lactate permease